MRRGFIFTVDAVYALVLALLLVNIYIINSAATPPAKTGIDHELLAKDKALTAFYRGAELGGMREGLAGDYYCYPVVREKTGKRVAEKQCEGRP
ncbi:MAG: hypothetical protein J4203_01500 [Candidatus Diapherotrites archaeon]|uniref:Uncharacterized protein n=1 Tax=Candidatus Iainarchaeum sp. TaxID=3101447 RepID=A0A8T4L7H1_9ARCH|nr:hypothetical protein [Candidatus Diapherotrites archaeon]